MNLGQRIAKNRKEKGFTQEYIAQELSVSRQAVGKWERNLSAPDTSNLIALAKLLGCTVEALTIGENTDSIAEPSLPFPFLRFALILFGIGFAIYLYGVISGTFNFMLMLPAGSIEIGTLLFYGKDPMDIALLSVAIVFMILGLVFAAVSKLKR